MDSLLVECSLECFLSDLRSSMLVEEECMGTRSSLLAMDSLLWACFVTSSSAKLSSSSQSSCPDSTLVNPLAGEEFLLSVVGVTAKWDSMGDCNRVRFLEYSSVYLSADSVDDNDTSLIGFAIPHISFFFLCGTNCTVAGGLAQAVTAAAVDIVEVGVAVVMEVALGTVPGEDLVEEAASVSEALVDMEVLEVAEQVMALEILVAIPVVVDLVED